VEMARLQSCLSAILGCEVLTPLQETGCVDAKKLVSARRLVNGVGESPFQGVDGSFLKVKTVAVN
jgi:hypothetical protein